MLVQNARVATEAEKINLLKHLAGQSDWKKQKSIKYCIDNADNLKAFYKEFYDNYRRQKYDEYLINEKRVYNLLLERYENYENDYHQRNELFNQRLKSVTQSKEGLNCQCGSKMRYVRSYDFIGCSNYQDFSQKHDTFNRPAYYIPTKPTFEVQDFDVFCNNFEFSKLYINHFRKEYDIPKDIMASILFEFLHMVWKLPKIATDVDGQYFTTGVKAKYQSKKEENVLKFILNETFNTVLEQPMIIYKIEGDNKTKCFPDFICSNENTVLVLEVKKNPFLNDPDQVYKYKALVNYIMQKNGINKKLIVKHYFYNTEEYGNLYNQNDDEIMQAKDGLTLEQISKL